MVELNSSLVQSKSTDFSIKSIETKINNTLKPESKKAKLKETYSGTCGANTEWTFKTDTCKLIITGSNSMDDYSSPSERPWHQFASDVKSIEIVPLKDFSKIGNLAFFGFKVEKVTIYSGITNIGDFAFGSCDCLTDLILPNSLTAIGNGAFDNCIELTNVDLPSNVEKIGDYAFYNCSRLTNLTLPSSLTSIGSYAFKNSAVSSVTFSGLTEPSYGDEPFSDCSKLTSVKVSSDYTSDSFCGVPVEKPTFGTCGLNLEWSFDNDSGILIISGSGDMENYSSYKKLPWSSYISSIKSVQVNSGATSIGNNAFDCCNNLTSVSLPSTLTKIGDYAFYGCDNLANIKLPSNTTDIGEYAFQNCTKLTKIYIPAGIKNIGEYAFYNCIGLTYVIFKGSVEPSYGETPFKNCSNLSAVTVPVDYEGDKFCNVSVDKPASSGTCGENAYWYFDINTGTISISGKGDMENYEFAGPWDDFRDSIKSVQIENGITSVGNSAFSNCVNLASVNIPLGVTSIGNEAFLDCESLTSINFPSSLLSIGDYAFQGCGFSSVTIPFGVSSIGDSAFISCNNLKSVSLPASLKKLGRYSYSFKGCSKLSDVSYFGTSNPTNNADADLFSGCTSLSVIKVPTNYAASDFCGISISNELQTPTSGSCGDNVNWSFDSVSGELTIDGSGDMYNWSYYPWNLFTKEIKSINIKIGVTSIGLGAFKSCKNLIDISIPFGVTSIEQNAFVNCYKLTSISIPSSVSEIAFGVFQNCENLTDVILSPNTISIGESAFAGCTGLTSIEIPAKTTFIGEEAFELCEKLETITFNGLNSPDYGNEPFYGCENLKTIIVPSAYADSTFCGLTITKPAPTITSVIITPNPTMELPVQSPVLTQTLIPEPTMEPPAQSLVFTQTLTPKPTNEPPAQSPILTQTLVQKPTNTAIETSSSNPISAPDFTNNENSNNAQISDSTINTIIVCATASFIVGIVAMVFYCLKRANPVTNITNNVEDNNIVNNVSGEDICQL